MIDRINLLIKKLNLLPHPEGGYYAETYRSSESISKEALPKRFNADRSLSTAIFFLIPAGGFSAFHKIKSDELWHFYEGQSLQVYVIEPNGKLKIISLGNDIENGEVFQAVVKAGCWFASKPKPINDIGYSFVGCTVSPGFDFADFELAQKESLINLYPQYAKLINELCR